MSKFRRGVEVPVWHSSQDRGEADMLQNWRWMVLIAPITLLMSCAINASENPGGVAHNLEGSLPDPEVTQVQVPSPHRILFVGNSYLYYNDSLHNHVKRMGDAVGLFEKTPVVFKSATIGGAALRDHAMDHLLKPENLRVDAPFELVVMQGISSAALTEHGRKRFVDAATRNARKIREAGGQPVLYMTPAYAPAHRRYSPEMTARTAALYIDTGNQIDALVIPVGLAFQEAYRRKPDIVLHKPFDSSHPELLGTYLAAATALASVYGVSPIGIEYDYFGAIDPADALFLQTVAHDTVTEFFGRAAP